MPVTFLSTNPIKRPFLFYAESVIPAWNKSMTHSSEEHRHFTRLLFKVPAYLSTLSSEAQRGQLQDISLKGALMRMHDIEAYAVGTPATLEVHLGIEEAVIRMQCRVAHAHGTLVGLKCVQLDLDSATHLRRLVELNIGGEALLERELNALVSEG